MPASERSLDVLVLAGAALASPRATDRALEDAVLHFFDLYQRPLTRYVRSFGLTCQDAEDIVQDTFVALFRHLRSGRDQRNLPGWLFRVAHNLALKHRRRQRVHWWSNGAQHDPLTRVDPSRNPEEQLVDAEEQGRWWRILQALPERDRQCVLLRAEGMKYREISTALGLSLGTVANIMTRAMTRLGYSEGR